MPLAIGPSGAPASVHVIHENPAWTEPLFDAFATKGIPYVDWNLADGALRLDRLPPDGVFYNRMSASSHTRGNRYAPEMTTGVLAWLEAHGRRVLNGRSAINLEVSKMVQYAALARAGLSTPTTIATRTADEILAAFDTLGAPIVTKHNRAGKGLGVHLFTDREALAAYVCGGDFEPSVDGITLVQRFIESPDKSITRVEFIGRELVYAVRVDASGGFELCPADACAVDSQSIGAPCPTDPRPAFEIIPGFEDADAGRALLPKLATVMAHEGLDVCAFEFIQDEAGGLYVYDINTNTNYNPDAEARAGVSAMAWLAEHLGGELTRSQDRAKAA